ncbi:DUF4160 domain-containing protein [Paraburkholderia sp. RP-4-7]|uniref:DUF4160 domain-containing protein n=1 Tax=Paraburkholderia polaris TaxID=2728848 RepID=A0A848IGI7_9BURK|nr:DUF4160 domain-containing protein [Paraburkholderia polaris]
MPIIARIEGLIVVIYPHDHAPPHVHVLGPDGEIIFILNCPDGPVSIRDGSRVFRTRSAPAGKTH